MHAIRFVHRAQTPFARYIFTLLCLPLTLLHGQLATSSAPEILHVHGTVINSLTHAPIAHALVTSADQRMALLTDANGRFEFDVRTPGARGAANGLAQDGGVYLLARKPGYRNMDRPVVLALGAPALSSGDTGASRNEVQLKLTPDALLTGRVSATGIGAPAGVNVQLFQRLVQDGLAQWNNVNVNQTGADGEFRFAELGAGEYKLLTYEWVDQTSPTSSLPSVPMTGYPPVAYPFAPAVSAGSSQGKSIHLSAGQVAEADLKLRAAPYYPVSIPVAQDATMSAVGVTVQRDDVESGFSLSFNPRTQQVEGALPDGLYHLSLQSFAQEQTPGKTARMSYGAGDLLIAGKPAHGAPIVLLPGAMIPVTVSKSYTTPDPNASGAIGIVKDTGPSPQIAAEPISSGSQTSVPRSVEVILVGNKPGTSVALSNPQPGSSGDDGLLIENVPPGSYRVMVSPHFGYASSVTADGVDLLRQPLVIKPEGGAPTITIVLRNDTATITGTLSGPPQAQAQGRTVQCYALGEYATAQGVSQTSINPDGTFTISGMTPGTYLLIAGTSPLNNLEYRNEAAARKYAALGTIVTLSPGQTLTVSLKAASSQAESADESTE